MFKRIPLLLALALGSSASFGVSVANARAAEAVEAAEDADAVSPELCEEYQDEQEDRQPKTDPGVVKIFKVSICGIYWYEAEDANGKRYTITQVTSGSVNKGHVDFGDGNGGRYCEWK